MSLFVVSTDWRFKERFKLHFTLDHLHEYSSTAKMLSALDKKTESQEYWIFADERLGSHTQKQLLAELTQTGKNLKVFLFLEEGNTPFTVDTYPFPLEFSYKDKLSFEKLFQSCSAFLDKQGLAPPIPCGLVGSSAKMQQLRQEIALFAKEACSIHLFGETGTGKEIAAFTAHSIRHPYRLMVTVNCSLLQGPIGESMFYGHTKGAFTDGKQELPGLVHDAHQSTLFLDEVENLGLDAQAHMLRLLESGRYRQLGDTKVKTSKFRLITASNVDLKELVREKLIRKDFYYRITDTTIILPPLREHLEDIPELCSHFIQKNFPGKVLLKRDSMLLKLHPWPGNVRQLFSVLKRCCIRSGEQVELSLIPEDFI